MITYVSSIYDAFPKVPEGGEGISAIVSDAALLLAARLPCSQLGCCVPAGWEVSPSATTGWEQAQGEEGASPSACLPSRAAGGPQGRAALYIVQIIPQVLSPWGSRGQPGEAELASREQLARRGLLLPPVPGWPPRREVWAAGPCCNCGHTAWVLSLRPGMRWSRGTGLCPTVSCPLAVLEQGALPRRRSIRGGWSTRPAWSPSSPGSSSTRYLCQINPSPRTP